MLASEGHKYQMPQSAADSSGEKSKHNMDEDMNIISGSDEEELIPQGGGGYFNTRGSQLD